MEIRFIDNKLEQTLSFDNLLMLNGCNKSGKTYLLKLFEKGFNGELDNFYINGNKIYKSDFKTIYIGDYNNFVTDFKLTKSNLFRKLIYDELLEKLNTDELLNSVNDIFNTIDKKINDLISSSNDLSKENFKLDINIDNIDKVIEKFTNIYIDDYLIDDNKTPRSTLRKLLLGLMFYQIEKYEDENLIVIIDDVDTSLDEQELDKLLNRLQMISNCTFLCSSSRNIYSYIHNKTNIYNINDKVCSNIKNIDSCIKHSIILNEYNNRIGEDSIEFNDFLEQNEHLINDEDINYFKEKVLPYLDYYIGKIYCSNKDYINDTNSTLLVKTTLEKTFLEILDNNLKKVDNL